MKRRQTGFTLMEILITVLIVSTALIPIFIIMTGSKKDTAKLTDIVIATHLASEKMELLKSKDCKWVANEDRDNDGIGENDLIIGKKIELMGTSGMYYSTSGEADNDPNKPIIVYGPKLARFQRITEITNINRRGDPPMKKVVVTVSWKDHSGEQVKKKIKLQTILVQEDL